VGTVDGAEGLFAIARFDKIAADYEDAVRIALIRAQEACELCVGGRDFDARYLEPTSHHHLAYLALVDRFTVRDSDIFIIPAQFGKRYAGKPVEFARRKTETSFTEFGLGLFDVLCMLITHPDRLADERALAIDAPGDQYFPYGRRTARHAPFVDRVEGKIIIGASPISSAGPVPSSAITSGSATGFLP
jgi:hypothetical protein